MDFKKAGSQTLAGIGMGLSSLALLQLSCGMTMAATSASEIKTHSPIKHVIVIIGENRSFDHVFATYVPKSGDSVWNLLSEGIVTKDGKPGPNFYTKAEQLQGDNSSTDQFLLSPVKTTFPEHHLPAPLVGGPKDSYIADDSLDLAEQSENGLPAEYYLSLISGGTGQTSHTPDQRITNVSALQAGPFQLTNATTFNYTDYAASPVHRFYQMWQQLDCSRHPLHRLTILPAVQLPPRSPGLKRPWAPAPTASSSPPTSATEYSPTAVTVTGEGSTALGFYNVQTGRRSLLQVASPTPTR